MFVDIDEAKNKIEHLVELVVNGEKVVITRDGESIAELVPCEEQQVPKRRVPGRYKGQIVMAPDFDDDLASLFDL